MCNKILSILKKLIYQTPLLNGLPDTRLYDFRMALEETFTTLLFATLPIWGGALLATGIGANNSPEDGFWKIYATYFWEATQHGLLIIFCASLLAPVFYTATREYKKGAKPFPSKKTFILCVIIIIFLAGGYIASSILKQPSNESITKIMSFAVATITLAAILLSTAYRLSIENADSPEFEYSHVIKSGVQDLSGELDKLMGDKDDD